MNNKYKAYLKLNLMSIFFIAVSFISVTLAWFAYSGFTTTEMEIGVKAWHIEFQKNTKAVSNDIVISMSDIYPGMVTVKESVNIKNLGDSDAQLKYSIKSIRILDEEYIVDEESITSDYLEDKISHDYPFKINIGLSKFYTRAQIGESVFDVSISWPLDSDTDLLDSEWGSEAYKFQSNELAKHELDPNYQIRSAIKVVINVTAEQYMQTLDASDMRFDVGDMVLYDVANNRGCAEVGGSCIKTHVISVNSKLGDSTIELLPEVYDTYQTGTFNDYNTILNNTISSWNVNTRPLVIDDIMNILSKDILNSLLIRENLSDAIIGNLSYENRMNTELAKVIKYNGYYAYDSQKYSYLSSNKCYWTSTTYNDNKGFAFVKTSETLGKVYGEDKTVECSIIPVIIAPKSNI